MTGSIDRYHPAVRRSQDKSLTRVLWPMPGGSGNYLQSLAVILSMVADTEEIEEVMDAMLQYFRQVSSRRAVRSYLYVIAALGLIEAESHRANLTASGRRYLKTKNPRIIENALRVRVAGVEELLALLDERPRRIGLLLVEMNSLGFGWQTQSQVRYRLRWLEEVGVVGQRGRARQEYFLSS